MLPVHRYWENEKVRLAYRSVHMNTLVDEVESFPPKARVSIDGFEPRTSGIPCKVLIKLMGIPG